MGYIPKAALAAAAQAGTYATATKSAALATSTASVDTLGAAAPTASGKLLVTTTDATHSTWQTQPTYDAPDSAVTAKEGIGMPAGLDGEGYIVDPAGYFSLQAQTGKEVRVGNNCAGVRGAGRGNNVGGQDLTNSAIKNGGTDGTVADYTINSSSYSTDGLAIQQAIYQIALIRKKVHDALRAYGGLT